METPHAEVARLPEKDQKRWLAEVGQILAQANALEHYAQRIRVDTDTMNHIVYGKLKIEAKLGELMPREKRGPGEKIVSTGTPSKLFHSDTVAKYRKVSDHTAQIEDYWSAAQDAEDPTDMSTAGFIRFVAADGTLKSGRRGRDPWPWDGLWCWLWNWPGRCRLGTGTAANYAVE